MASKATTGTKQLSTVKTKLVHTKTIEINNDEYSISEAPDPSSKLVENCKKELLQSMSIQSVITELDFAGKLMFVAGNALAGTSIESTVKSMQVDFAELCYKCEESMSGFAANTESVITQVQLAISHLYALREVQAVKSLSKCATYAKTMSTESGALAKEFENLRTQAQSALSEAIKERNKTQERSEKLEAAIAALKADHEGKKEEQASISKAAREIEAEYIEVKEQLKTAETREFILGITQAFTSAVAAGVGAYASANPAGMAVKAVNTVKAAVDEAKEKEEMDEMNEEKEKADADVKDAEEEVASVQGEIDEAEGEAEQAKEDETAAKTALEALEAELKKAKPSKANDRKLAKAKEALKDATKAVAAADERVAEKNEKLTEAKKGVETAEKVLAAVSEGLQKFSDKLEVVTQQASKAVDRNAKAKTDLLREKMKMQEKEAELLGVVAKLAVQIQTAGKNKTETETAVRTLTLGVHALGMIIGSLLEAAHFWKMMATFCQRLASPTIVNNIEDVSEISEEERKDVYYSDAFKRMMVSYVGRWVALHAICTKYTEEARRIAEKVKDNVGDEVSIERSRERAPALAEEIMGKIAQERAKIARQNSKDRKALNILESMIADEPTKSSTSEETEGEEDDDDKTGSTGEDTDDNTKETAAVDEDDDTNDEETSGEEDGEDGEDE